jgi:ribulose-5-phosphate 4-epimerase/fuculose-1-phosphate aldolase
MDEGYVKFTLESDPGPPPELPVIAELNRVRTELVDLALIGMYPSGIGYGNVSIRVGDSFWISGTATGGKRTLAPEDYARVVAADLERNTVRSLGTVRASSESMTHAAVYDARPDLTAVLHVHSRSLFRFMLEREYPRTPTTTPYGTPEMAGEIGNLVRGGTDPAGVIVMAGHEEGVLSYGTSLDEALAALLAVHAVATGRRA